jgi:hypothetical protein
MRELTDNEFQELVRRAHEVPNSPYYEFMLTHTGYDFYQNGHKVDKWEVFGSDLNLFERVRK